MPKKATKAPKVAEPVAKKGKKPAKVAPPPEESSEDDDTSEEEEVAPVKKATPAKPVKKMETEDSSDDDEDDSEEEAPPPVKAKKQAKPVAAAPAGKKEKNGKAKVVAPKDESDDEEDSDDDDSEEEPPAKAKTPAKKQKTKEVESDDDEDESGDEEDSSEEEETPPKKETSKRKNETKVKEVVKKPKLDESVSNGGEPLTLFVGGLPSDCTEDEVTQLFTENEIELAEVRKIPNKKNAFVDLKDHDDLDKAIALTGRQYMGSTMTVEKAKPKVPRDQNASFGDKSFSSPGGDDKDSRTLFVKFLPDDVTQESLGTIFENATDIRIPQKDGYPKGFAFVEFADTSELEKAYSEKQGAELGDRTIKLDYMGAKSTFKSNRGGDRGGRGQRGGRGGFGDRGGRGGGSNSGARGESKTLFVKNLSWDTDESSLKSVFDGVVHARIPTFEDSGKPKGFAFVEFSSPDAAATAFDNMSGQSIDGRQVTLDFAAEKSGGFGGGRGRGGDRGGRGFGGRGGDRGGRGFGRGRGGDRGGRGGFNKERGGIVAGQGKKKTFDDSD